MYFICTGHNAFFYEYLRDYLLIYVLNILFRVIDITAPLVYSLSFGIQRQRIILPILYVSICPHGRLQFIFCASSIYVYTFTFTPHTCVID